MKIKFYKAGIACASLTSKAMNEASGSEAGMITVVEYRDVNGGSKSCMSWRSGNGVGFQNVRLYDGITPVASSEVESDFNVDSYSIGGADILPTSINKVENTHLTSKVVSMDITNTGSSSITVKSIKFYKRIYHFHWETCNALVYVVYLDSPLTIPAGETRNQSINFAFYNPVAVTQ